MRTVAEALREAAGGLAPLSDTARLDAELLMAAALDCGRSQMLLNARDCAEPDVFPAWVERRRSGEPVAYITGRQDFYGRSFIVDEHVLIPRADSETVVEAALRECPAPGRILDCGTGSGILLLTLLTENDAATGIGIDRSTGALAVARANARMFELDDRVTLLDRDWTRDGWTDGLGRFDLIVANPPYVEEDAVLDAGVRNHEPAAALFAGPDGLADYRVLVPLLSALLTPDGVAVVEIGHRQSDAVAGLATAAGLASRPLTDLADRPRGLVLRRHA